LGGKEIADELTNQHELETSTAAPHSLCAAPPLHAAVYLGCNTAVAWHGLRDVAMATDVSRWLALHVRRVSSRVSMSGALRSADALRSTAV
jgi:hypothetical protein